ncbi:complex I NDUFA9 subunit family protein [Noviherbaspirillum pedocola]|uniref:Complex I NDUFA9 subunit family protein n=1 Tax=Noviherbaspirillum pedocola TaxID=2801341 RepID=A0A934STM0_9BURK|nr:complex I NDUFA9 subunit family protein [Noviherbaspirillum pedocola]MBK4736380.1 complex I NDUFA9 subunit family protein [Noviherbaspirillum pedocola]
MRLLTASRCDKLLVLGGTGFIGSRLVARLVDDGRRVLLPTRRETHARHLIMLPGVEALQADIHDEATLARLAAGCDAVINLVGVLHSRRGHPYGPDFARAHVELPRKVVAACRAAGVRRYLHMSALGASDNGPSMYLRSKAAGELAALSDPMLRTTIFRPSVVFGEGDSFLNMFAQLQGRFPFIPLGGADAKFQPVYVEDVVGAFVEALEDHDSYGRVIELVGPKVYTLRELVRLAGQYSGHSRPVIGLPNGLARLQAWFLEHAPGGPVMSRDNLDSMRVDNVAAPGTVTMPTAIEDVAPFYIGPQVSPTGYEHTRHHA